MKNQTKKLSSVCELHSLLHSFKKKKSYAFIEYWIDSINKPQQCPIFKASAHNIDLDRYVLGREHFNSIDTHRSWNIQFNCIFLRAFVFWVTIAEVTDEYWCKWHNFDKLQRRHTNALTKRTEVTSMKMCHEWQYISLDKSKLCTHCSASRFGSCFYRLLSLVHDNSGLFFLFLHTIPLLRLRLRLHSSNKQCSRTNKVSLHHETKLWTQFWSKVYT